MKSLLAAVLAVLGLAVFPAQALADTQTFTKPKSGGYRVDWCYSWGAQCGQPAANRYCKTKGFDVATDFDIAEDIGDVTPTKVLKTGQICADPNCDGFSYITCQGEDEEPPPAIEKTYSKPMLPGGYRLHWCYTKNSGCGKPAAKAFCNAKGFSKVIEFNPSPPLSQLKPTRYIGSGKKCKEGLCEAFSSITCSD